MPSFTSSFDRAPQAPWGRVYAFTMLLAFGLLLVIEVFWRSQGAFPDYVDDRGRWADVREAVGRDAGPNATALIGRSRIRLGFAMPVLETLQPGAKAYELAIDALGPVVTFERLVTQSKFAGVVIFSLRPIDLSAGNWDGQIEFNEFFETKWNLNQKLNFIADDFLQGRLITRSPRYGIDRVINDVVLDGQLPPSPNYMRNLRWREADADYTLVDLGPNDDAPRKTAGIQPLSAEGRNQWLQQAEQFAQLARQLQARGGRLVLVRFPTAEFLWARDDAVYPKDEYWDYLVELTGATGIHFMDYPQLQQFRLPDGRHLDQRDKGTFTAFLIEKMQRQGVFVPH